jgi:hypothetical protein
MHQTVGNVLRTFLHGEPPQNIANAKDYVDEALSISMHAMRVGIHSTMGSSPGNLVFNRGMFLNIPLIADRHAITLKREHLINENLMSENQKWRRYDYSPQQRILKKTWKPQKPGNRTTHITNTCKWYSNHRVATRNLREIEHTKNHTVYGIMLSVDLR